MALKLDDFDEVPAGITRWLTAGAGRPETSAWPAAGETFSPKPAAVKAAPSGYRIGQSVTHPKFGQGGIVNAEGSGTDARLQINFGRQGMKWLALEYAKLMPA